MKIKLLGQGSRYRAVKKALEKVGHIITDDCELIILANHNKILKKEEYENVRYGAICCHAGKLPKYRGSSVLNWQIINGEEECGWSIIRIDEGIDTGDIIRDGIFRIESWDDIASVREKADYNFSSNICPVVSDIELGLVKYRKQYGDACYWHHRKPSDSHIKWSEMTAVQVHNLVRASEKPYEAHAYKYNTINPANIVYIPKSKLIDDGFRGIAGRVVRKVDDGVMVIANDYGIWIKADIAVGEQLW